MRLAWLLRSVLASEFAFSKVQNVAGDGVQLRK
jgi:hypothetical protein